MNEPCYVLTYTGNLKTYFGDNFWKYGYMYTMLVLKW